MQEFNLNEQKQIFKDALSAGDIATAEQAAKCIIENAPESVYGYYYFLVVKTENFTSLKNAGSDFDEVFEKFLSLSNQETVDKYTAKVTELKEKQEKAEKVKQVKVKKVEKTAKRKVNKLCALIVCAICFIFALGVIIPSAIYANDMPSSSFKTVKWDNGAYDSVVFELTPESGDLVGDIWLNISNAENKDTANFYLTSNTSGANSSYYISYGGGDKTVSVSLDKSNGWVRLTTITATSARKYFQLATKQEVRINEVVFLNQDGEVISASVKYAGPNSNANKSEKPSPTLTSDIYAYRVKEANALLDEQSKFDVSCVSEGVYTAKHSVLTEREAITLESALNILNGGTFVDDTVNPFGLQLISVGVAVFGANVLGLRIVPMLFAIATILLVFFVGRKLFDCDWSGLIFAGLYAISGFALSGASVGMVESIFVFFALLSIAYMFKFYNKVLSRHLGFRYYAPLVLSGIFFALALSVKMQALYTLVALVAILVLALVKQYKLKQLSSYEYERKLNLSIVSFIVAFIIAGVVWTGLTYVFSIGVYANYYVGLSFSGLLGKIFSMPARVAQTAYSANNTSNIFANLLGFKAEALSTNHYFFGNTVVSALSMFSVLYSTVYVVYSFIAKSSEVKTAEFKKQVLTPYMLLGIAFAGNWILSLFNASNALSSFALTSVFYTGFIVLALNLLASQSKKIYKEVTIAHVAIGVVVLFALIVFGFAVPKYLGLAVSSYPLNIGAFRW